MKKNRLSLRRLFSNTKFLIIFSIVVAFIFWVVVALEYAPIVENVIEKVPVTIEMENSVPDKFGLQIFGQSSFTVDVTVRGSRSIVGGNLLNANDFEVTAQTAYVNSPGSHTLQLKVTAKNPESEYEIVSLSSDYIEVYFDKYDEKEVSVEPRIVTTLEKLTDDDYSFDENELMVSVKTVKLTGAKTEIDRIQNAYLDIKIDRQLTECQTVDASVTLDNATGDAVKYVSVNGEADYKVPVTIPVYRIMELPTSVSFKNIPSAYINNSLKYSCTPATVRAAVLQNGEHKENSLDVGTVDFNELSPSSRLFAFETKNIENIKILDSTKVINAVVSLDGITSKTVTVDEASVKFSAGDRDKFNYNIEDISSVTVIGPSDKLAAIKLADIVLTVNTSELEAGKTSGKVTVSPSLGNSPDCWIYGKYELNISKK